MFIYNKNKFFGKILVCKIKKNQKIFEIKKLENIREFRKYGIKKGKKYV